MADLTSTFDDLANWGDVAIVPTPDEDDPNPIYM
jgi:hypothetical protein